VRLEPLTDPAAIEHWFDDPEVQRWLGGRSWLHRPAEEPGWFRGRMVSRSHSWVGFAGAEPVAFVGGEVYDRWVRYHGDGVPPTGVEMRTAMGLAYVVDPARWGRGHGRAALRAVMAHPAVADVAIFFCGIEPDNLASRRCAEAAGLHLVDEEPDFEDMLYYRRG
jgi:RimJ/RimL family protein N-acetyltransferase